MLAAAHGIQGEDARRLQPTMARACESGITVARQVAYRVGALVAVHVACNMQHDDQSTAD